MNTSILNQYKYLAKVGDGALAFHGSVPCYLPSKANGCYESENGSLVFYGKCVQNGTPSPSSPVAVEYVDGDGRIGFQQVANLSNVIASVGRTKNWAKNRSTATIAGNTITVRDNRTQYASFGIFLGSTSTGFNEEIVIPSEHKVYTVVKNLQTIDDTDFKYFQLRFSTLNGATITDAYKNFGEDVKSIPFADMLSTTSAECYTINIFYVSNSAKSSPTTASFSFDNRVMIFDLTQMGIDGSVTDEASAKAALLAIGIDVEHEYCPFQQGTTLTMPDLYGIGDIRDTYEPCVWVNGALRSRLTRRIGVVDMGTLGWIRTVSYGDNPFFFANMADRNGGRDVLWEAGYSDSGLWNAGLASFGYNAENKSIGGGVTENRIYIRDDSHSNTYDLKQSLLGYKLYYPLATPVITLGDPQPVQSYGGATNIFHTSVVQPKIAATVVQHKATPLIYGFHVDSTVSDPSNAVTYLNDAVGMTPAHMDYDNGVFDYGSWADAFFMPRPCMLRSDGTVAYYLNPNNYAQKADGTASDIANEAFDGNAMMEWGQNGKRIYYAIIPDASVDGSYSVYISDTKVNENYNCWSFYDKNNNLMPHFYTPIYSGSLDSNNKLRSLSGKAIMQNKTGTQEMAYAKANGEGWYIEVFADKTLMFLLLYLMGKSLNVQTTFGQGHTSGGSSSTPATPTGQLDDKGLFFGYSSTTNKVKVFGMEDQWGERWKRTAGLMLNNGTIYYKMTAGTADGSTATDYTDGTTTTGMLNGGASLASSGYMTKMRPHDGKMLLASAVGGSATTYYCDYWHQDQSGVRFALLGGDSSNGAQCGFYAGLYSLVSRSAWFIGAALSCKPLIQ